MHATSANEYGRFEPASLLHTEIACLSQGQGQTNIDGAHEVVLIVYVTLQPRRNFYSINYGTV